MNKNFLFLDYYTKNIQDKEFVVIYVLEFYSKKVFKIYKLKQTNLIQKLETFEKFDNLNDYIDFTIKSNNTLALNINL